MSRIVTILPKGEGFSPERFGAIALCVRDFTLAGRLRGETLVVGGTTREGFAGVRYQRPSPARWFENRTRAYARGCLRVIGDEQPLLVEIHNRPMLLRLIGRKVTCKTALHLHNDPQEMAETRTPPERARLLAMTDGVYCVSRYIRDRFLEGLPPGAAERLHVVPNGIALPDTLPPKEKTILFAGRMTEGKGALLLARALRHCLPQMPDWRAVFVGSRRHEAGRLATSHETAIAAELGPLHGQAELTGFLSHAETLAHFARAAIAVVPSQWPEPFGRTALEAMAYGCAVISSGTGGLREVTGDAALTPEALTPDSLADAILRLARDVNERTRLQSLARERATLFDIATCASLLDAARDAVLGKTAR